MSYYFTVAIRTEGRKILNVFLSHFFNIAQFSTALSADRTHKTS